MLWKDRSQRTLIAAAIAVLVAATAGLISAAVGSHTRVLMENEIGRSAVAMARQVGDRFDRMIASRGAALQLLADGQVAADSRDTAQTRQLLEAFVSLYPSTEWVGIVGLDGRVRIGAFGRGEGVSLADTAAFREGMDGFAVSTLGDAARLQDLLPAADGAPDDHVDLSLPIHDGDGELSGVMVGHFRASWLRLVEQTLRLSEDEGAHARLTVVGSDGNRLLSDAALDTGRSPALQAALAAGQPGWRTDSDADGTPVMDAFAFSSASLDMSGPSWTVLIQQPLRVAYAPISRMQRDILLVGLALAVAFSGVGWWLAGRLARPLQAMAEAADEIRAGRAVALPDLGGSREVAMLQRSLSDMLHNLTRHKAELTQMQGLAFQDRLTGLPNRRFFESYLEEQVPSLEAQGGTLTFLFIDLDGFKPVNDRLGHSAGDFVLTATARRLAEQLRDGDIMLRLGGDEFVAVLRSRSEIPQQRATSLAQRLISCVNQPIDLADGESVQVGCSIGIASWPRHGADVHQAIARADESLYQAKAAGRNMAVLYGGTAQKDETRADRLAVAGIG